MRAAARAFHARNVARTTAALLSLAVCASCDGGPRSGARAAVDRGSGEVPFRLAGNGAVLLVAATVNGEGPFNLVFDTGATITCLDESVAARLALPSRFGVVGFGAGVGGSGRVRLVRVDSLRVGGALSRNTTACVLDLRHLRSIGGVAGASTGTVHGLLGLNFLKDFQVQLDFERQVLTLKRPPE